jgi:hypothetical protein
MNNVGRPFRLTPVITDMKIALYRPLQALVWWNYIIYLKGRRTLQLKKANLSVQNVQLDVLMSSLLSLNQRVSMEATSDSRFAGEARPSTANQLHALRLCGGVAGQQGLWAIAGQGVCGIAGQQGVCVEASPDSKGVCGGVAGQQGRHCGTSPTAGAASV